MKKEFRPERLILDNQKSKVDWHILIDPGCNMEEIGSLIITQNIATNTMSSFEHSQMKKTSAEHFRRGASRLGSGYYRNKGYSNYKKHISEKGQVCSKDSCWHWLGPLPALVHTNTIRVGTQEKTSRGFMFYPMSSLCQRLYELAHACQLVRCMLPLSPIWKFYNFEKNILKAKRKKKLIAEY